MGIPGRSDKPWGLTSWKDLLLPWSVMKYAGYAVWNVRGEKSKAKPATEWEIVPNAHSAIITDDEAKAILNARREARILRPGYRNGGGRAHKSKYLLTGGVSKCDRCGSNLISHRTPTGRYYVCGSEPYRAGKGCGKAVYVPVRLVESQIVGDIRGIISKLSNPKGFTRKVNAELKRMWESQSGYNPDAEKQIRDLDRRIGNVNKAIEEGLQDAAWANRRTSELKSERDKLSSQSLTFTKPLQVDVDLAMKHRDNLDHTLQHAKPEERKKYVQSFLSEVRLFPDIRKLHIRYRIPCAIMNNYSMDSFVRSIADSLAGPFQ